MQRLEISVAKELRSPGKVSDAAFDFFPENMSIYGRQLVPCRDMHMDISYSYDGESGITIKGSLKGLFRDECARCGKAITVPFETEFEELFVKQTEETEKDDSEEYGFTGETIDLSDFTEELILLNYPMVTVCDEACKGLCPVCGCDRNEKKCGCMKDKAGENNPFYKVLEQMDDDGTVN